MRHQIKEKRTRSMLRIELNRTCRLGSPDGERSRTDLSLRVLKMLARPHPSILSESGFTFTKRDRQ
jgi:hypothetical protein